ncbi:unnamed protein product [Clonostachys rosea]|uniref:Copper acquisition factor BIM1-like domain-containing protein n=1 Tax=Bionectria ochroleuca TaxID=29856 RepID=A0ABY6V2N3_BIOOC|nr:unnamed protein product [Clonostachys rosea]
MAKLTLLVTAVMQLAQPLSATPFSWTKYGSMGPIGFAWPPDRTWSYDTVLDEPCGAPNVGNRTEFPLMKLNGTSIANGAISLQQKQEAYDFQVSITYSSNPSNKSTFFPVTPIQSSLEYTRLCLNLTNLPDDATVGQNATLQLQYTAPWYGYREEESKRHMEANETFYVCADIILVDSAEFLLDEIPSCFNITADYENSDQWPDWPWDNGDGGDDDDGSDQDEAKGGVNGSGISVGAVVGIAVGGFLAVALIAAIVAWGIYLARKGRKARAEKEEENKMSKEEEIAAAKKLDDSDSASLN